MLLKYLIRKWPLLILYIAVVVAAPAVHVYSAYASGTMLDYASEGDYQLFFHTLLIFLGYFVIHGALLFVIQVVRIRLVSVCRRDLRQDMFRQVMSTDNTFFSKPDAGFHIAAFSNDITILEKQFFSSWLELIEGIISVATVIAGVVTLNTQMAVIIIGGYSFSILLCFLVRGYSINKNKIFIDKLAAFTQRIKDYSSAFPMFCNYSVQDQIRKRFNHMNEDTENAKDDADMSIAFVNRLSNMCIPLIKFTMVGYGLTLVMTGKLTMGLIFTAYQFSDQLVGPVNTIINRINSIQAVQSIVKRIKNIANASVKEKDQMDIQVERPVTLTLDNVSLSIDGVQILKGITCTFEHGKKYLIIGRNGSGKSTLLKLIKRSTEEYSGSILINGKDVKLFSYRALSKVISYINESVPLLCDTVRENIILYRDVSEEKLQEAVKAVNLTVDLDRVIRDGDLSLSSGETRRLEIARSLIGYTNIIIFDEAISTLDICTAYEIEKMLLSLPDQTVLFVSHNFSAKLIRQYDEIILLEDGQICGRGTHDELMKTNAYYQRIMSIKNG